LSKNINFFKNKITETWPGKKGILTEFIFYLKEKLHLSDVSIYVDDYSLSKDEEDSINQFITLKKQEVPLDYILEKSSFYGNNFFVDPRVLIPRPETEILVDFINKLNFQSGEIVIDAGTGSGCIGISLAIQNPHIKVYGLDFSKESLEVANKNKNNLKVENFVTIYSDWLSNIEDASCNLIVSNPPYISSEDKHLRDLHHEPLMALTALDNGLADFKTISSQASSKLLKGGMLAFEHGYKQKREVSEILKKNGFKNIETLKDHQSHPRITIGILSN
jgi:release factor glutamine methyltransferase